MDQPLALPEIIHLISRFLNNKALFQCIQVSKQWHHLFLPYLWSILSITGNKFISQHSFNRFRQNSSLVKVLSVDDLLVDWYIQILKLNLPALHTLRVKLRKLDNRSGEDFLNLIRRHGRGLHTLHFNPQLSYSMEIVPYDILDTLGDCCGKFGRLRDLSLHEIPIQVDALSDDARRLFGQLDSFSIKRVRMFRDRTMVDQQDAMALSWPIGNRTDLGKNNIRHLSIDRCGPSSREPEDEYELIVDCQQIQSLTWTDWILFNRYHRTAPLIQDLRKGWWPFLERLHLPWTKLSDKEAANIILAMNQRPLRELNLEGTDFGPLSTMALLWRTESEDGHQDTTVIPHHRLALEVLYLKECEDLTGTMIQQMLCSFPNLRRFNGTTLTSTDVIADPRPWVCNQLVSLHLCFGLEERLGSKEDSHARTGTDLDEMKSPSYIFLERLKTLLLLEVFLPMNCGKSGYSSMDISNQPDMEELSSLRRLKVVWLDYSDQMLTLEDAKMMVRIWPVLKTVLLFNLSSAELEAVQFLRTHGIQCTDDARRWLC